MDQDLELEAYCDAQDRFAQNLTSAYACLRDMGKKKRAVYRELAGQYAIPTVQIARLVAYGLQDRSAQNGVLPEVYGEILRKVKAERAGALMDAAETSRWNIETAASAVKAHRTKRCVESVQVRGAWRQVEAITEGVVTADAILELPPADQYELAKPLRTVARFAGQAKKRKSVVDPNQLNLDGEEAPDG